MRIAEVYRKARSVHLGMITQMTDDKFTSEEERRDFGVSKWTIVGRGSEMIMMMTIMMVVLSVSVQGRIRQTQKKGY